MSPRQVVERYTQSMRYAVLLSAGNNDSLMVIDDVKYLGASASQAQMLEVLQQNLPAARRMTNAVRTTATAKAGNVLVPLWQFHNAVQKHGGASFDRVRPVVANVCSPFLPPGSHP